MSNYMIIKFDWSDEMSYLDDLIVNYLETHNRTDYFERADDKYDIMRLMDKWLDD